MPLQHGPPIFMMATCSILIDHFSPPLAHAIHCLSTFCVQNIYSCNHQTTSQGDRHFVKLSVRFSAKGNEGQQDLGSDEL